jgi:hypothetical protein
MTPKEKAVELVRKCWIEVNDIAENSISWRQGKKCAVICVQEILNNLDLIHKPEYVSILIDDDYIDIYQAIEYWNEVKTEIEKL